MPRKSCISIKYLNKNSYITAHIYVQNIFALCNAWKGDSDLPEPQEIRSRHIQEGREERHHYPKDIWDVAKLHR